MKQTPFHADRSQTSQASQLLSTWLAPTAFRIRIPWIERFSQPLLALAGIIALLATCVVGVFSLAFFMAAALVAYALLSQFFGITVAFDLPSFDISA